MKKNFFLFFLNIVFVNLFFGQNIILEIENFLNLKMSEYKVPGIVCSYIKDEKVVKTYNLGFSDLEGKIKITPRKTLFRINNITELFTTYLLLDLVNKMNIDIKEQIKEYSDLNNEVTLKEILTHTTGYDFSKMGINKKMKLKDYLSLYEPQKSFKADKYVIPTLYDMALGGYLVQYISKSKYEIYLKKKILNILHMNNTFYEQPLPFCIKSNKAIGYNENNNIIVGETYLNTNTANGGYSTIEDINKFLLELIKPKLLNSEIIKLMFKKEINNKIFKRTYGFNVKTIQSTDIYYIKGTFNGFSSQLIIIPKKNIAFSLLYNKEDSCLNDEFFYFIINSFFKIKNNNLENKMFDKELQGIYSDLSIPKTTVEKFSYSKNVLTLKKLRDNKLRLLKKNKIEDFVCLDDSTFLNLETGTKIHFIKEKRKELLFYNDKLYKKLMWYENPFFYKYSMIGAEFVLVFIFIFLVFKYLRNIKELNEITFEIIFDLVIFIEIVSIFIFTILFFKNNYFINGINWIATIIPYIIIIITIIEILFTIISMKKNYLTFFGTLIYLFSTVASIIFLSFFKYFNFI